MKQSDITPEIIALSRKIAEYWRMEIYKGCWYCDIDILCLWHENYEPDFPDEVFPIPSISDCLEKLRALNLRVYISGLHYKYPVNDEKWYSVSIHRLPYGEEIVFICIENFHEALLQALLAVLEGSHE